MRHEYKKERFGRDPRYGVGSATSALRNLAIANRLAEPDDDHARRQQFVRSLTNRERNKWARAGYPGLKDGSADEILNFNFGFQLRKLLASRAA